MYSQDVEPHLPPAPDHSKTDAKRRQSELCTLSAMSDTRVVSETAPVRNSAASAGCPSMSAPGALETGEACASTSNRTSRLHQTSPSIPSLLPNRVPHHPPPPGPSPAGTLLGRRARGRHSGECLPSRLGRHVSPVDRRDVCEYVEPHLV